MRSAGAGRKRGVLALRTVRAILAGAAVLALACGGDAGEASDGEPIDAPDSLAAAAATDGPRARDSSGREGAEAAEPGTRRFVNTRDALTGPRADHYVDFAFRYPASWRIVQDATTPDTPNFVKVERVSDRGTTLESFAAGWFSDPAAARGDSAALAAALDGLESQLARAFDGFEATSRGTARIAGREAPGFRFAFRLPAESEVPRAFGRVVLVPTGGADGLALMMFATPLADGVEGPADVGEAGGLATVLRTLELGATPVDGPASIEPRDLDGAAPAIP